MEQYGNYFIPVGWTLSVVTGIVVLLFFRSLVDLKGMNAGVQMILILCISDLAYSFKTGLDNLLLKDPGSAHFLSFTGIYIYRWSLYWSVVIALFSYFVIVKKVLFDPKQFLRRALKYCSVLAFICPVIIAFDLCGVQVRYIRPGVSNIDYPVTNSLNQVMYLVVFNFIGTLLPILMIAYCYWRVSKTLKEEKQLSKDELRMNNLKIFAYVAIPFLCFVPGVIADTFYSFQGRRYPIWLSVVNFGLRKSWCVSNLLIYWFLGSSKPTSSNDDDNYSEISRSSTVDFENLKDWD